jgi:EpsI family protein
VSTLRVSIIMASLMLCAFVAGTAGRAPTKDRTAAPKFLLEDTVPRQFGEWQELPAQTVQVVNPQTQDILDKLYSQVLTRTYANAKGYRIMLSIAYGDDQRGALQAHKPEVCYPAQGFKLESNEEASLPTQFGAIPIRRLSTSLGQRKEPVTYWFTMGDTTVKNRFQQRLVQVKLGLTGQIPDGMLVRVSSIDASPQQAFEAQDAFANAMLAAVSPADRVRLGGLADALQASKP